MRKTQILAVIMALAFAIAPAMAETSISSTLSSSGQTLITSVQSGSGYIDAQTLISRGSLNYSSMYTSMVQSTQYASQGVSLFQRGVSVQIGQAVLTENGITTILTAPQARLTSIIGLNKAYLSSLVRV